MTENRRNTARRSKVAATLLSAVAMALAPAAGALADGGTTSDFYQPDYYANYFNTEGTCDSRGAAMLQEVYKMVGWDCYQDWFDEKWSMGVYWMDAGGGGGGGSWSIKE